MHKLFTFISPADQKKCPTSLGRKLRVRRQKTERMRGSKGTSTRVHRLTKDDERRRFSPAARFGDGTRLSRVAAYEVDALLYVRDTIFPVVFVFDRDVPLEPLLL